MTQRGGCTQFNAAASTTRSASARGAAACCVAVASRSRIALLTRHQAPHRSRSVIIHRIAPPLRNTHAVAPARPCIGHVAARCVAGVLAPPPRRRAARVALAGRRHAARIRWQRQPAPARRGRRRTREALLHAAELVGCRVRQCTPSTTHASTRTLNVSTLNHTRTNTRRHPSSHHPCLRAAKPPSLIPAACSPPPCRTEPPTCQTRRAQRCCVCVCAHGCGGGDDSAPQLLLQFNFAASTTALHVSTSARDAAACCVAVASRHRIALHGHRIWHRIARIHARIALPSSLRRANLPCNCHPRAARRGGGDDALA